MERITRRHFIDLGIKATGGLAAGGLTMELLSACSPQTLAQEKPPPTAISTSTPKPVDTATATATQEPSKTATASPTEKPATPTPEKSLFNPQPFVTYSGMVDGVGPMIAIRLTGGQSIKDGLYIVIFKSGTPSAGEGTIIRFISLATAKLPGPFKMTSKGRDGNLTSAIEASMPDSNTISGTLFDTRLDQKEGSQFKLTLKDGGLKIFTEDYAQFSKKEFNANISSKEVLEQMKGLCRCDLP